MIKAPTLQLFASNVRLISEADRHVDFRLVQLTVLLLRNLLLILGRILVLLLTIAATPVGVFDVLDFVDFGRCLCVELHYY